MANRDEMERKKIWNDQNKATKHGAKESTVINEFEAKT